MSLPQNAPVWGLLFGVSVQGSCLRFLFWTTIQGHPVDPALISLPQNASVWGSCSGPLHGISFFIFNGKSGD